MESELTKKLEELKRLIQHDYGEVRQLETLDDCIALSKQPPLYAMSRDYSKLYDHLEKGGEAIVRWMGRDILEAHTWTKESVNGLPLQGFTNRCGHLNLEWLAPSPQAVTVEGKWISVDERLPELKYLVDQEGGRRSDAVLVYPNGSLGSVAYCYQKPGFDPRWYAIISVPAGYVTHWMPLPSAPASTNT